MHGLHELSEPFAELRRVQELPDLVAHEGLGPGGDRGGQGADPVGQPEPVRERVRDRSQRVLHPGPEVEGLNGLHGQVRGERVEDLRVVANGNHDRGELARAVHRAVHPHPQGGHQQQQGREEDQHAHEEPPDPVSPDPRGRRLRDRDRPVGLHAVGRHSVLVHRRRRVSHLEPPSSRSSPP